ncbi:MAG: hypothetical protein Q4G08_02775 [Capnocytophaga sp.]|nr:hypothetical protein [Capnocytophaga sp.]
MLKKIFLFILPMYICAAYGQDEKVDEFRNNFSLLRNEQLREDDFFEFIQKYNVYDISEKTEAAKQAQKLASFIDEAYASDIRMLLDADNPYQRAAAYAVIGILQDTEKETLLLERIASETHEFPLVWAGVVLMSFDTQHTDELFEYMVANYRTLPSIIPQMYARLNKASLRQTAFRYITSDDMLQKAMAAQIFAFTGYDRPTEKALRKAVQDLDLPLKGYAIYSLKELRIGNLSELLRPLLKHDETRQISLMALQASPSEADRQLAQKESKKKR